MEPRQMLAITASIDGPDYVDEGSAYTLTFSASASRGSISYWTLSWGDGSSAETYFASSGTATHSFTDGTVQHSIAANVYADETLTVGENSFTTYTSTYSTGQTVEVENVDPSISLGGASTNLDEGKLYTLHITSSDPGDDTVSAYTVSWGDGQTSTYGGGTRTDEGEIYTTRADLTHFYADGTNTYTIGMTVTDEDGSYQASESLTVNNVTPSMDLTFSPNPIDEGSDTTLYATVTDPGDDTISTWTVSWNDGQTDTYGGGNRSYDNGTYTTTASFSHRYADGTSYYGATVTATDEDGSYVAGAYVLVYDVSAYLQISGDTSVQEGSTYGASVSYSDVEADPLSYYTVDWGDGTSTDTYTADQTPSHVYPDGPATCPIAVTAIDVNGETYTSSYSPQVTVNNVAPADPSISLSKSVILEGGTATLSGSFTDPGTLDWHTVAVDWGDGSDSLHLDEGVLQFSGYSHRYNTNGRYSITATITDKDGASTVSSALTINVVPGYVNSTADNGDSDLSDGVAYTGQLNSAGKPEVTLRAAIQQANANGVPGGITFNIGGGGSWTISASGLPGITVPLGIDGASQPGYSGTPLITISGGGTGLSASVGGVSINALGFESYNKAVSITADSDTSGVTNNLMDGVGTGVELDLTGSAIGSVTYNSIDAGDTAIHLNLAGTATASVANNTIDSGDTGAYLELAGSAVASVSYNNIDADSTGVDLESTDSAGASITHNTIDTDDTGAYLDLADSAATSVIYNTIDAGSTDVDATSDLDTAGSLQITNNTLTAGEQDLLLDLSGAGTITLTANSYDGAAGGGAFAARRAMAAAEAEAGEGVAAVNLSLNFDDPAAMFDSYDNIYLGSLAFGFKATGSTCGSTDIHDEDFSEVKDTAGAFAIDLISGAVANLADDKAGDDNKLGPRNGFSWAGNLTETSSLNIDNAKAKTALTALSLAVNGEGTIAVNHPYLIGTNTRGALVAYLKGKETFKLDGAQIYNAEGNGISLTEECKVGGQALVSFTNLELLGIKGCGIHAQFTAENNSQVTIQESGNTYKNISSTAVQFTFSAPDTSRIINTSTLSYIEDVSGGACKYTLQEKAVVYLHLFDMDMRNISGDVVRVYALGSNTLDFDFSDSAITNTPIDTVGVGIRLEAVKSKAHLNAEIDRVIIDRAAQGVVGKLQCVFPLDHRPVGPGTQADEATDDEGSSSITISDSTIQNCTGAGILIADDGTDQILGNTLSGNGLGLQMDEGSPYIAGNTISGNAGDGVLLGDATSPIFSGNTITNNYGPGVEVQTLDPVSLAGNTVSGNHPDFLLDGASNQQVTGTSGGEAFSPGAGNDTLTGGGGGDTFVFGADSGQDTITDFSPSSCVLDLRQTLVGNVGFAGLTIAQDGSDAVIDLGGGSTIRLAGIDPEDLTADDFIFNS